MLAEDLSVHIFLEVGPEEVAARSGLCGRLVERRGELPDTVHVSVHFRPMLAVVQWSEFGAVRFAMWMRGWSSYTAQFFYCINPPAGRRKSMVPV